MGPRAAPLRHPSPALYVSPRRVALPPPWGGAASLCSRSSRSVRVEANLQTNTVEWPHGESAFGFGQRERCGDGKGSERCSVDASEEEERAWKLEKVRK